MQWCVCSGDSDNHPDLPGLALWPRALTSLCLTFPPCMMRLVMLYLTGVGEFSILKW